MRYEKMSNEFSESNEVRQMNTNVTLLKNKNQFVDTCDNFASVNDLRIAKILAERDEASKDPNTPRIPIDEAIQRLHEKMHNL